MNKTITLPQSDWHTLLDFVKGKTAEIAEFDDEDEIYLAVVAVVGKIERQLGDSQQGS